MGSFGNNDVHRFNIGSSVRASSNPEGQRGGTIDWSTVSAASEDVTYNDGREVKAGEKCLRYGTILVQIKEGQSKNMFGPFDPNASDGRQELERGHAYILDETICESDGDSNPQLIDGGSVWKARLLVGESNQPTWDTFYAAFPRVRFIEN